jgi:5-methylthioadenosine/S-adenosylhomocysteine deaminase
MALALTGRVVTFDADARVLEHGTVYVGDDGRIAAVQPAGDAAPAGFAAAKKLDTKGVVYPGLIDLHSHVAYNTLPLWEAADVPYKHHDSWPGEDHPPPYATSVSWPVRVLGQAAAEALIKYVEVKALVGGTTAIQGAPHTTRPVDGWLARIVDVEKLPAGRDLVMCSALQQDVGSLRDNVAPKLRAGQVMIYHVAEGQVGTIVHREIDDLESGECLQPGLIGVHATALTKPDFDHWQEKVHKIEPTADATIVWSPFSNLWLYHATTDVVAADAAGVRICLGSDWAPSGTKHVLGELKVADLHNRTALGGHFSDEQLCAMVTANPGDALAVAWGPQIGRLAAGGAADVLVCDHLDDDPFRNLIAAREKDVRLVLVRGTPFYGTKSLMKAAGAVGADAITVAGQQRAVVVQRPGATDAKLDWKGVTAALNAVRKDPAKAWQQSLDALAAWGGALDEPEAPLALFGDMPEGDLEAIAGAGEIPVDLKIPALDSLSHDKAFKAALHRAAPDALKPLADYYP